MIHMRYVCRLLIGLIAALLRFAEAKAEAKIWFLYIQYTIVRSV